MTRRDKMMIKQEERAYLANKRAINEQTTRNVPCKRAVKAISQAIGQKWVKGGRILSTMMMK